MVCEDLLIRELFLRCFYYKGCIVWNYIRRKTRVVNR